MTDLTQHFRVGFDMGNFSDPAGLCVLYTDENGKVSHVKNIVSGYKADLIYQLLTSSMNDYILRHNKDKNSVEIEFLKEI